MGLLKITWRVNRCAFCRVFCVWQRHFALEDVLRSWQRFVRQNDENDFLPRAALVSRVTFFDPFQTNSEAEKEDETYRETL